MNSVFMLSVKVLYAAILVYAVIGRLKYLLETAEAISLCSQNQNLRHVAGIGGTTSVHWCSSSSSLLIGTKKGRIYCSTIDQKPNDNSNNSVEISSADGNREINDQMVRWNELESNDYKTKYPIYSMSMASSSYGDEYVFCGSGDRWISVWRLSAKAAPEFVQKLGPHTGWVKDMVYDEENLLLHSIGCNCVESWDCAALVRDQTRDATTTTSPIISHTTKRAIENSPTMGTTLSSDLLCLCSLPPSKSSSRLLVSGGVDGRIHLWLSDPRNAAAETNLNGKNPLHTASAHDGRVNAIVHSSATNTIFTVGNDGSLCAFRVSIEKGFELVSKLKIDEGKNSLRITVASIVSESEKKGICSLALGSSNGALYFAKAQIDPMDKIDFSVQDDSATLGDGSMVYSMISEKGSDRSRLWVGHASGLAVVDRY